jgi:hypothetical protein
MIHDCCPRCMPPITPAAFQWQSQVISICRLPVARIVPSSCSSDRSSPSRINKRFDGFEIDQGSSVICRGVFEGTDTETIMVYDVPPVSRTERPFERLLLEAAPSALF